MIRALKGLCSHRKIDGTVRALNSFLLLASSGGLPVCTPLPGLSIGEREGEKEGGRGREGGREGGRKSKKRREEGADADKEKEKLFWKAQRLD